MEIMKQKVIHSLSWSFGASFFRQASSFVIIAALARLLSPDDFGLLGMATVFIGFATIFGELGFSAALIQKQDSEERHYSSAFWLNVACGIALTVLFILISPLIAGFYNKPQLKPLIFLLSFNFIVSSFSIVQRTRFTKEMNFKLLSIFESISVVVSGIAGIVMALSGYGVWSLVIKMMGFTYCNTLLLWIFSSWRPRFLFSTDAIREIFTFSIHITGFNVVNYLARNIDYLLIGRFLGTEALGFYTLAYKLMLYPLQNISWIISRVMYPAFSRIQDKLEKVRHAYITMTKAISLVTFPMMLCLLAIAPEFIMVVYGSQWIPAIELIRILSICGMVQTINTTAGNIVISQGRSDLYLKLGITKTVIVTFSILVGLQWGLRGVVVAYASCYILWAVYEQHVTNSLILLSNRQFILSFYNSISLAIGVALSIFLMKTAIRQLHGVTVLATSLLVGGFVYIALLALLKEIRFQSKHLYISILRTVSMM